MHIFLTDIRAFEERRLYEKGLEYLTPGRASRTVRLKAPGDRQRSLGAGLLLEYGLRQFGLTAIKGSNAYTQVVTDRGAYGKPYIRDSDVCIGISHSGDYAVAAFSDRELGIDIERIRAANQHLVSRFFSEKEREYWSLKVAVQPSDGEPGSVDPDRLFTRLWTRKESYIKATGEGMRTELGSFSVVGDTVESAELEKGAAYRLFTAEEPDGYMISVCEQTPAGDAPSTINITFINGEQLCMMN
jgi:4'-phosphopantetheinyl transferase